MYKKKNNNRIINKKKIKYILKKISKKILPITSIKIIILGQKIIIYQEKYIHKLIFIKFKNKKSKYFYINKSIKNNKKKNINIIIHLIIIKRKKNDFINIDISINKKTNISILEEYINIKKNKYFNYHLNMIINKKSTVNFIRIINTKKKYKFYIVDNIKINNKSKLNKFIFFIKFKNINLNTNILLKKKSILNIKSISTIKKKNIINYKTNIIHYLCKNKSYQKHNNILLEPGKINFSGWIKIFKKSNNSKAIINNNNLCICKKSIINSSPKLGIWNKNTKCKHSVKINNLNKNEIFYLLTRGIKYLNIKKILILNFIKKILIKIKNKNIYKKILYIYLKLIK